MAKKNDYVTDILELEQLVGENAAQFSMAREITIPGEVKRIKEVDNEITEIKTEVVEDKVLVEGTLDQKIIYLDDQGTEKEQVFNERFVNYVSFPGISSEMMVRVFPRIEFVEYDELLKDQEKTIFNRTIVMEVLVMCCEKVKKEIVLEVPGGDPKKVKKEKIGFNKLIGAENEVIAITSELTLNEPAARVNSVTTKFEDLNFQVSENKLIIEGNIIKKILYLEEVSGSQIEESVKDSFSHSIEITGAVPGMEVKVYPRVERLIHQINPQERNKIKQVVFIDFIARVTEAVVVEAVSGIEDSELSQGFLNLYKTIGEASDELSLVNKLEVNLPVRKITLPAETNIINLKSEVVDGTLEVSGTLKTKFIYISDETGNIEEETSEEYFDHKLYISGLQDGMLVYIYPRVEYSNFEILDDRKQIKQTALIKILVSAVDPAEQEYLLAEGKEEEPVQDKPQTLGTT
ncbi:MAG: hypothetical protein CVU88_07055, partial [Firmicutes bacterium HGW-Firmicutes-13]